MKILGWPPVGGVARTTSLSTLHRNLPIVRGLWALSFPRLNKTLGLARKGWTTSSERRMGKQVLMTAWGQDSDANHPKVFRVRRKNPEERLQFRRSRKTGEVFPVFSSPYLLLLASMAQDGSSVDGLLAIPLYGNRGNGEANRILGSLPLYESSDREQGNPGRSSPRVRRRPSEKAALEGGQFVRLPARIYFSSKRSFSSSSTRDDIRRTTAR